MAPAPGVHAALEGTKPWVRLCSVLLFVSAAMMIVFGVLGALLGAVAEAGGPQFIALAFVYPLIGLLYLLPALYLYRYASRIGEYLTGGQEVTLELALDAQRSFWKFVGVTSLVGIVVMVLGIIAAIAIPAVMYLSR